MPFVSPRSMAGATQRRRHTGWAVLVVVTVTVVGLLGSVEAIDWKQASFGGVRVAPKDAHVQIKELKDEVKRLQAILTAAGISEASPTPVQGTCRSDLAACQLKAQALSKASEECHKSLYALKAGESRTAAEWQEILHSAMAEKGQLIREASDARTMAERMIELSKRIKNDFVKLSDELARTREELTTLRESEATMRAQYNAIVQAHGDAAAAVLLATQAYNNTLLEADERQQRTTQRLQEAQTQLAAARSQIQDMQAHIVSLQEKVDELKLTNPRVGVLVNQLAKVQLQAEREAAFKNATLDRMQLLVGTSAAEAIQELGRRLDAERAAHKWTWSQCMSQQLRKPTSSRSTSTSAAGGANSASTAAAKASAAAPAKHAAARKPADDDDDDIPMEEGGDDADGEADVEPDGYVSDDEDMAGNDDDEDQDEEQPTSKPPPPPPTPAPVAPTPEAVTADMLHECPQCEACDLYSQTKAQATVGDPELHQIIEELWAKSKKYRTLKDFADADAMSSGPKLINIMCGEDMAVTVRDLDTDSRVHDQCMVLVIRSPYVESKLVLHCDDPIDG